ncbi:hypothetical protein CIK05_05445 [Bdellovibrio sp. qaytius]|nr:hypothetical protein CIK05_05445 [Bdellovibrio sp. qaytius]
MKKITAENFAFIVLLVIAAGSRLVQHSWNFTAIMASAYVFAIIFRDSKTKAILLPVLAMLLSDFFISLNSPNFFHSTMAFVYLAIGLSLVPFFASRKSLDKTLVRVAAILGGSAIFFIVSNFGVWLMDGMYPMTGSGLIQSYTMGIPFFQNQLAADIVLTPLVLFAMKRVLALDFFQAPAVVANNK